MLLEAGCFSRLIDTWGAVDILAVSLKRGRGSVEASRIEIFGKRIKQLDAATNGSLGGGSRTSPASNGMQTADVRKLLARVWKGRRYDAPFPSVSEQTIVGLARAFEMDTVAEGVEIVAQLDVLREMGCDQLQGYLMSKPVSRDEFASLLAHGNGHMLLPAERASGIDRCPPKR